MKRIKFLSFAVAALIAGGAHAQGNFYGFAGAAVQSSNAQTNMQYVATKAGAQVGAGYEGDLFGGEVRYQWMPSAEVGENVEGYGPLTHVRYGVISQSSVAAVARVYAFDRETTFRPYAGVGAAYYALSGTLSDGAKVSGKFAPVFEAGALVHVATNWRVGLNVSYSPLVASGVKVNPLTVALTAGYTF